MEFVKSGRRRLRKQKGTRGSATLVLGPSDRIPKAGDYIEVDDLRVRVIRVVYRTPTEDDLLAWPAATADGSRIVELELVGGEPNT